MCSGGWEKAVREGQTSVSTALGEERRLKLQGHQATEVRLEEALDVARQNSSMRARLVRRAS